MQIWCLDTEFFTNDYVEFTGHHNTNAFNHLSILCYILACHTLDAERESNNSIYPLE